MAALSNYLSLWQAQKYLRMVSNHPPANNNYLFHRNCIDCMFINFAGNEGQWEHWKNRWTESWTWPNTLPQWPSPTDYKDMHIPAERMKWLHILISEGKIQTDDRYWIQADPTALSVYEKAQLQSSQRGFPLRWPADSTPTAAQSKWKTYISIKLWTLIYYGVHISPIS